MSRCPHCGEPVHPHAATCGACGTAIARGVEPRRPEGDGSEDEFDRDLEAEPFAAEDDRKASPARAAPLARPVPFRERGESVREPASPNAPRFLARAVAFGVDLVILTALQSVLRVIAALAIFLATFFRPDPVPDPLLLREWLSLVGVIALAGGYFIVLHSDPGQTLGKALFRLRVVTTEGGPLGLPQSCLRLVGYIFSALPLGFGFLLAAFPPGRALHDQLAGSKVVVLPERVARSNAEVRA